MRRIVILTAAVVAIAALAASPASRGAEPDPATDVVARYVQADAAGVRLSSETWGQTRPLIAWAEEPGWDYLVVVSGWTIKPLESKGARREVRVDYDVVGVWDGDNVLRRYDPKETIVFEVERHDGAWRIVGPVHAPRVSVAVSAKRIEEAVKALSGDAAERCRSALRQLEPRLEPH